MISSTKLEKEKTTNNQCLKKFDYRLIYNYFFEIPLCSFLKWRDALNRLRLCQKLNRIIKCDPLKDFIVIYILIYHTKITLRSKDKR